MIYTIIVGQTGRPGEWKVRESSTNLTEMINLLRGGNCSRIVITSEPLEYGQTILSSWLGGSLGIPMVCDQKGNLYGS
jgi:hypothetical protein